MSNLNERNLTTTLKRLPNKLYRTGKFVAKQIRTSHPDQRLTDIAINNPDNPITSAGAQSLAKLVGVIKDPTLRKFVEGKVSALIGSGKVQQAKKLIRQALITGKATTDQTKQWIQKGADAGSDILKSLKIRKESYEAVLPLGRKMQYKANYEKMNPMDPLTQYLKKINYQPK